MTQKKQNHIFEVARRCGSGGCGRVRAQGRGQGSTFKLTCQFQFHVFQFWKLTLVFTSEKQFLFFNFLVELFLFFLKTNLIFLWTERETFCNQKFEFRKKKKIVGLGGGGFGRVPVGSEEEKAAPNVNKSVSFEWLFVGRISFCGKLSIQILCFSKTIHVVQKSETCTNVFLSILVVWVGWREFGWVIQAGLGERRTRQHHTSISLLWKLLIQIPIFMLFENLIFSISIEHASSTENFELIITSWNFKYRFECASGGFGRKEEGTGIFFSCGDFEFKCR